MDGELEDFARGLCESEAILAGLEQFTLEDQAKALRYLITPAFGSRAENTDDDA
jgi:hypothetical protein